MATTWHGQDITELPMVSTWKIGTGGRTTRTYKGKEAPITNKANELQLLGWETEITTGPVWTLVATYNVDLITDPGGDGQTADPVPVWELTPNNFEMSIFECQRPFVNGMPQNVRTRVEAKLKNPQKYSMEFLPPEQANNQDLQNAAARVYHYKQMGVDGKLAHTLTLKRSIVVPLNYTLTWSTVNAEKVLSTNRVISEALPPANIRQLMPSSYASNEVVGGVEGYWSVVAGNMDINFYFGWLEYYPSIQTVGSNRCQISQEWVYNKWIVGATGFYDVVL